MAIAGDDYLNSGKVMLAAVISLSIVIFLVVLLHLYARWLLRRRRRQPPVVVQRVLREPPPSTQAPPLPGHAAEVRLSVCGLDRKVVEALPVFVYRAEEHERGLECVVCLSAMEEEESGRRLPACGHAFHVGCIDTWLTSHATCPICRALVKITEEAAAAAAAAEVVEYCEEAAAAQILESSAVESEMVVEIILSPGRDQVMKEDESSPSSSSSFGASLRRMLSRGRSQ